MVYILSVLLYKFHGIDDFLGIRASAVVVVAIVIVNPHQAKNIS